MKRCIYLLMLVSNAISPGCLDRAAGREGDDPGQVEVAQPVIVCSENNGTLLQGGDHQLLWIGSKYAILYQENVSGKVFQTLRFIDAEGATVSEPFRISDEYTVIEDMPEKARMVRVEDELRLFWPTQNRRIMMRRVGDDGRLLSDQIPAVKNISTNASLSRVIRVQEGFALLWEDDRITQYFYLPYFVRIDPTGLELMPHALVVDGLDRIDTVGGMVERSGRYSMTWNLRQAYGIDRVYLSRFDPDGNVLNPPLEIYQAENAILSYYGSPVVGGSSREFTAVWDMDRGVVLVETENGLRVDEHEVLEPDRVSDRPVMALTDKGIIGLLYGNGEYQQSNPLATQLELAVVDTSSWEASHRDPLNQKTYTPGSCLESYDIVHSESGFGVSWVEGCSDEGRVLYFVAVKMPGS